MNKLMTIKDLAEKLQISIWTVYSWTSKKYKGLPVIKVGGHLVRFSPDKIDQWITQQEVKKKKPNIPELSDDENGDK